MSADAGLGTICGGSGGDASLLKSTIAAVENMSPARFEDPVAFASILYPTISDFAPATNNFVLSMLYRWTVAHPEVAPTAPLLVASVTHPVPSAAALTSPTSNNHSEHADAVGAGEMSTLDKVTGLPPAKSRALTANTTPAEKPTHHTEPHTNPTYRVRCSDVELILAGIADSQTHGVVYLASQRRWHSGLSAAIRDESMQASEELFLHAACKNLIDALLGDARTQFIGAKGFAMDAAPLLLHTDSLRVANINDLPDIILHKKGSSRTKELESEGTDPYSATMLLSGAHAKRPKRSRKLSMMLADIYHHAHHDSPRNADHPTTTTTEHAIATPAGTPAGAGEMFLDVPAAAIHAGIDLCSPPASIFPVSGHDITAPMSPTIDTTQVYGAIGPVSVAVAPGTQHAPFHVKRFVGPELLVKAVSAAYIEAASKLVGPDGTAATYYAKLFKQLDVYEFVRPSTEEVTPTAAGTAEARGCFRTSLNKALERAIKARELGIEFRHATNDDYKTIAHDFYRFYKETYKQEVPEKLQQAKAAELRAAIDDGEYFILSCPADWLVEATGVSTKIDMEIAAARERRAKSSGEHGPPAQSPDAVNHPPTVTPAKKEAEPVRLVPVGMASVRGHHPRGARIAEVYVKEEYRRKGFAVLILNMLLDLCVRQEGLYSLCIFGDAANEALVKLAEKAGFIARDPLHITDVVAEANGRACAHNSCVIQ